MRVLFQIFVKKLNKQKSMQKNTLKAQNKNSTN